MNEGAFGGLVLILFGLACYFLPTICAGLRGKANGTGGVFLVNLLLGWTLIGWLVSFIWACSGTTEADKRREEERHRELLAATVAGEKPTEPEMPALLASTTPPETPVLPMLVVAGIAILAIIIFAESAHAQQQTRTTCYDSGPTRICETFDGMGSPISKSRCYQSGKDTRCDTQSFGGTPSTPLPLDRRPIK